MTKRTHVNFDVERRFVICDRGRCELAAVTCKIAGATDPSAFNGGVMPMRVVGVERGRR